MAYNFIDKTDTIEQELAATLAKVSYHVHPKIVEKIVIENKEYKSEFLNFGEKCNEIADIFLYEGSDCLFPGVRRPINKEKPPKKNSIYKDGTILNDNTYPRHIWAYISAGKSYSGGTGGMWKDSLSRFELAHIFAHKKDERMVENEVFKEFNEKNLPYALFTSASNTVLIPKGIAKPTDNLKNIKIVFFQRYLELYSNIVTLPGLNNFDETKLPEWYGLIKPLWNEPVLPENWESDIEKLMAFRKKHLRGKYGPFNKFIPK